MLYARCAVCALCWAHVCSQLSEAMVLEMQAATQTSLKQLSTTLPAWQADKRRAADEDLAGVVQAVRAADAAPAMQAAGSTGILAAMQSHSSQPGVKVATKGKDDASGAARPASGMLAAMQAYANLGSAEFTPQQVKLLVRHTHPMHASGLHVIARTLYTI